MNQVERAAQAAQPGDGGALKPLEVASATTAALCTPAALLTTVTIFPGVFAAGNMVSDFVGMQDQAGGGAGLSGKSSGELLGIRLGSIGA
ncbi:hypothetical protein [Amycolatopsis minnesotensis]|uniref:Uncharacterized protein n=1 Tax=Amycolatopsis minnesotensis TaxID=337894 RepID=A0ABN2RQ97_9PSEU